MNILITGAYGFIGSYLSSGFVHSHKYRLIALDLTRQQLGDYDEFYSWEQLNKIESENLDVIFHLAGKAHDIKNISSEQEYFNINVGLTQKIFQHFLKSSATKFIFFSSVKAVADSVTGDLLTEESFANPKTPYGKSKLEAERYILTELQKWRETERGSEKERVRMGEGAKERWGERVIGRKGDGATERLGDKTNETEHIDKKVYILRPCMIHGSGNKGNLNLLFKLQQKGLPWPLGAFENKRSFCSVDNILFVVQQLIEEDIEPGIYQVADDDALSTNELIKLIASSQNKKTKIWNIPVKLIKGVAYIGDFLHLPLNSERLKKLTEAYLVSNQKIKSALGIDKMPVSASVGLQKTFESFKKK